MGKNRAITGRYDRWRRFSQALIFIGALAALVLTLGTAWLVQSSRRDRERRSATAAVATQVGATVRAERAAAIRVAAGTPVPRVPVPISPENAGQVVELARWGRGSLNDYAWSADGRLLAVASSLGIYLYDARTLAELRLIDTGAWVEGVALSPDGELVASMSPAGLHDSLQLWRVADGTLLGQGEISTGRIPSVAFSPDGRTIVVVTAGAMWFCPVQQGKLQPVLQWETDVFWRVTLALPRDTAFSPDGRILALEAEENTVRLWEVETGALQGVLEGGQGPLAFSPDGQILASEGPSATVRLWSVPEQQLLYAVETYTAPVHKTAWVSSLAFAPDGQRLAAGFGNGNIHVWRTVDGSLAQALVEGPSQPVTAVVFSPDGQMLATASRKAVQLWRAADGALLDSFEGPDGSVGNLSFSPDGQLLSAAGCETHWQGRVFCDESAAMVWQVADGRLVASLVGETMFVSALAFRPDGQVLAVGFCSEYGYHMDGAFYSLCDRGWVLPWSVARGVRKLDLQEYRTFEEEQHQSPVSALAFSADGHELISVSADKVRRWLSGSGGILSNGAWNPGYRSPLALSPDASILAYVNWDDRTLEIRQAVDGALSCTYTLPISEGWISEGTFSADGTTLAYAWRSEDHVDQAVYVVRPADGTLLHTLRGFYDYDYVDAVAFSPDGRLLSVASDSGTIRLWRVEDGALLYAVDVYGVAGTGWWPGSYVTALVFSPDGTVLASVSSGRSRSCGDCAVRLWRVEDGALLATLEGHRWGGAVLSFSPDGTLLASGSEDGTIRLWGVLP